MRFQLNIQLPTVKHDAPQNIWPAERTLSSLGNCTGIPADSSSYSPIVSEFEWRILLGGVCKMRLVAGLFFFSQIFFLLCQYWWRF